MAAIEFKKPKLPSLDSGNLEVNFKVFKQSIQIYFKATKSDREDKEVQMARLLNLLGSEGLKIYNTFNLQDPTVDEILRNEEILEDLMKMVGHSAKIHNHHYLQQQKMRTLETMRTFLHVFATGRIADEDVVLQPGKKQLEI